MGEEKNSKTFIFRVFFFNVLNKDILEFSYTHLSCNSTS